VDSYFFEADLREVDLRELDFFEELDFFADFFRLVDLRLVDLRLLDLRAVDLRLLDLRLALLRLDDFFAADFLRDDFFAGTLPPSLRASERPIAIACSLLFTVLPEPLLSLPRLRSCIARFTLSWAFLPYFAIVVLFG
jgi:uncharacterized protein YjbI with pentapeptide repeats